MSSGDALNEVAASNTVQRGKTMQSQVRRKGSEWEILGERNRAALNQNFARELPLEYRATLKNYYERVAK